MNNKDIAKETVEKLQEKAGGVPNCPFCNNNQWTVSDTITLTSSIDIETKKINPSNGIPGVSMSCKNCGFTASINPKVINIIE